MVTPIGRYLESVLVMAEVGLSRRLLTSYLPADNESSEKKLLSDLLPLARQDCRGIKGEYCREELLTDLLADAIEHVVERGFPQRHIPLFFHLYVQCLDLLSPHSEHRQKDDEDSSTSLSSFVTHFKQLVLSYAGKLTHHSMTVAISYITESVLQHYHLYQFLLSEDQPLNLTTTRLTTETPTAPPPLVNSVPLEEWKRREKLKEIEMAQTEREREFVHTRDTILKDSDSKILKTYESELSRLEETEGPTEELVSSMVDSLAAVHVESVLTTISQDLKKSELDVGFRAEKVEAFSPKRSQESPSKSPSPVKAKGGRASVTSRAASRKK